MKIIISERQLRRIIKEFQDIYDNGLDLLSAEIEKEIKAGGFTMGSSKNGDFKIDKDWSEKRKMESYRLLNIMKEKIINFLKDYYKLEEGEIVNNINKLVNKLFVLSIHDDIEYRHHDTSDWESHWISDPNTGRYDYNPSEFKKSMNHLMKKTDQLLDKKKMENLKLDIDTSKTRYAPSYSGEELENEDTKRIYDWEYTKTILEKLIFEYINNEEYINKEMYDKIMGDGIINIMMEEMDDVMENNNYEVFSLIRQNNFRNDFSNFLKSYTKYYKQMFNGNEQQFYQNLNVDKKLPPEIQFGRMLWDMTYWIK